METKRDYQAEMAEYKKKLEKLKENYAKAEAKAEMYKEKYEEGKETLEKEYGFTFSKASELVKKKEELEGELEEILDEFESRLEDLSIGKKTGTDEDTELKNNEEIELDMVEDNLDLDDLDEL